MEDDLASIRLSSRLSRPVMVADLLLQALAEANVDYIFAVYGSDHPSIMKAYADRQKKGFSRPQILLFLHEFAAISAADGYTRETGIAQCVLVHVDVGTLALGQGLHTASSGKVPMVIFAGLAPCTLHGELPGSRSEPVQWYQDVPPAAFKAPYSRYSAQIMMAEHVSYLVQRAVLMASTGTPGPSYLTANRETLATTSLNPNVDTLPLRSSQPTCLIGGLPEHAVTSIGTELLFAKNPLIITGYLGRNRMAVDKLIKLADLVKGLRVLDAELREVSFPASHPAYVWRTDATSHIKKADVLIVLDADVPWVPAKVSPHADARIYHIDIDPRKEYMQQFDIRARATYHANSEEVLDQLYQHIHSHKSLSSLNALYTDRETERQTTAEANLRNIIERANPRRNDITVYFLVETLRSLLPKETIFVHDAVTNQVPLVEQLRPDLPGTSISKGSSGLGWAPGAAVGVMLALKDSPRGQNEPFVCALTGDGAFMFGSPAAFWAQHEHRTPFLTVVLNNGGWNATRGALNDVHPGVSIELDDAQLGNHGRTDGPDYVGIAVAASGGRLRGRRVDCASKLADTILEAVKVLNEGKASGVIMETVIS